MSETLVMSKKERTKAHYIRLLAQGSMSITEVSEALGLSERQCYRLKAAYLDCGDAAVVHKLRGRCSNNHYPADTRDFVLGLVRRVYTDFGPTLLSEMLEEEHRMRIDSETLRRWLLAAGLWQRVSKGHRHRKRRPRRMVIGDLVQVDGSHHDWFEGRGPVCCLFVFIDDASNQALLRFAPSEDEHSALTALRCYIDRYGIPRTIYVDRHSVYFNEDRHTQFARAAAALGIEILYARSPQAKGRVERANRTHQDRLVKMLRLAGISDIESANAYLESTYLERHNARFASSDGLEDVHRDPRHLDLDNIICRQEERTVRHDMTIQVHAQFYQILRGNALRPLPRQRVTIRWWLDGTLHAFWREKELRIDPCAKPPGTGRWTPHPPEDHPWRRKPPIGKAKKQTFAQLCRKSR